MYASVSLVLQRRQVETPVYSDERALWADRLPYELGRGRPPLVSATAHRLGPAAVRTLDSPPWNAFL